MNKMIKFGITLILLATLVLPAITNTPVLADTPEKIIQPTTDLTSISTYTGKSFIGVDGQRKYEYEAIISTAPMFTSDMQEIDCQWYQNGRTFVAGNNLFKATVIDTIVQSSMNGKFITWNPSVWISGKEFKVINTLPTILGVDPTNDNYYGNILEWDYGICVRHLRIIHGQLQETYIFSSNPNGDIEIKSGIAKDSGFTYDVPPFAYDANGNNLKISANKIIKADVLNKAVYPVTIDPTINVNILSDGYLEEWDAVYLTANDATSSVYNYTTPSYLHVGQDIDHGEFSIERAFLYFNTSALSGFSVVSANLSIFIRVHSDIDRSFTLVIQNGQPTYPSYPPVPTDFNNLYYSGNYGSLASTSFTNGAYNNISLTPSIISSTITKLCLRNSWDIAYSAPTERETVDIYGYSSGAGHWPYLTITYTTGAAPVYLTTASSTGGTVSIPGIGTYSETVNSIVPIIAAPLCGYSFVNWTGNTSNIVNVNVANTTINMTTSNKSATANFVLAANPLAVTISNATYVSLTTARLNGALTGIGCAGANAYFQYGVLGSGIYTNTTTQTGLTVVQPLYQDIASLTTNTTYTYRLFAFDGTYTVNSSWSNFTTYNTTYSPPTSWGNGSLYATPTSTTMALSWYKATGTINTFILYKETGFPTSPTDGLLVCLTPNSNYLQTGLLSGHTYYYSAWAENGAGNYSANYSSTFATTLAGAAPASTPNASTLPSNWYAIPDSSRLSNLSFYGVFNMVANTFQMPYNTWWFLLIMGFVLVSGLYLYSRSSNLLLAVALVGVELAVFSKMGLLPLWIVFIFIIIALGVAWKEAR